jgi:hypothetical protein
MLDQAWTKDASIQKDIKALEQLEKTMVASKPLMPATPPPSGVVLSSSSELALSSNDGSPNENGPALETVSTDTAVATLRRIMTMAAEGDWNEASRGTLVQRSVVKYRG